MDHLRIKSIPTYTLIISSGVALTTGYIKKEELQLRLTFPQPPRDSTSSEFIIPEFHRQSGQYPSVLRTLLTLGPRLHQLQRLERVSLPLRTTIRETTCPPSHRDQVNLHISTSDADRLTPARPRDRIVTTESRVPRHAVSEAAPPPTVREWLLPAQSFPLLLPILQVIRHFSTLPFV